MTLALDIAHPWLSLQLVNHLIKVITQRIYLHVDSGLFQYRYSNALKFKKMKQTKEQKINSIEHYTNV